jgi:phosphoribosylanthranilate isomerase
MRIKVCGMTKAAQVKELDELGAEFAGFIFYPKSPRYVFKQMPAEEIKKIKGHINKVGVFVNETPEELLRIVDNCGLYLVQLHGDETPRYCEKISNYISVIKAFRINNDDNIEWKIKNYVDTVDMFMFDTGTEAYGGSGKKFDWEKLKNLNINKPFFLSGGIGAEDAEALQNFSNYPVAKDLFAVDINSKFEILPGIKDITLISQFVKQLNG